MKITAILKDFTEQFYAGTDSGSIPSFDAMANADKWATIKRLAQEKRVTLKIGTGQFRDAVELNSMMKNPCNIEFKLEPRRGYKLATFEVTA